MTPGRRRVAWALGFAAVMAVAAWARLANAPAVLASGEVLPPDGDSAYHALRILRTAEHFPRVPTFDPDVNWPAGGMCPWAGGFDLLGAAFVLALGGGGSPQRAALLAALYPVVLGLLVVWAAMALARAVAPEEASGPVALAAGLLAALLPQGVAASRFARADHHVAEALSMVLLARWALARPTGAGRRRRALFEVEGALLAAGAVWVFSGATVYVALAAGVAAASILAEPDPPPLVGSGAPALLGGGALAAALTLPAISEHGRWMSFVFPSLLQPALVAGAGAALALAALARRALPRAGPAARAGAFLGAACAGAAAAAIAWPGLGREVARGIGGWLLHRDPWLSRVDEFQPLWSHPAYRGPWSAAHDLFGAAGWLAPLSVALGGAEAARADRRRGLGFAAMGAALLLLTLLQIRFGRVLAPFLAVATALALAWLARAASAATRRRLAGGAVLLGAALLAAADPRLRGRLATSPPAAPDAIQSAALDLRDAARPRRGAGVATRWDLGHYVEAIAGRPVVANGFGRYLDEAGFEEMARLGAGTEAELYALMERRDLGFLVAGAATMPAQAPGNPAAGAFERRGDGATALGRAYLRAVPLSPLLIAGSGVPALGIRHLSRLLPRFASAQRVGGISFPLPVLWTWERVAGARLAGAAAPGARVVAELAFREHGWPHVYRAFADAGGDGRWELVVPLPTGFARPTLWTEPRWQVRVGQGPPVAVAVPESAVRAGSLIPVGPPAPGAAGR